MNEGISVGPSIAVMIAIIVGAAHLLLAFAAGVIAERLYSTVRKIFAKPTPLERLKNALLSFALIRHGRIDSMPAGNYRSYDGTVLPAFSGYSVSNACFSYIQFDHDRIFGPFTSRTMNDKHAAVVRYLDRNLATLEQVLELFDKVEASSASSDPKKTR